MPRPSFYTPELAAAICDRLASGRSLRSVAEDEDMPHRDTIRRWLKEHEDFRTLYAQAGQERVEALFEDMLAIADDRSIDWQERKVMIAARQWAMSKLAPKKYGDRVELANDPDAPVTSEVGVLDRARVIAFALAKAAREVEREERDRPTSRENVR